MDLHFIFLRGIRGYLKSCYGMALINDISPLYIVHPVLQRKDAGRVYSGLVNFYSSHPTIEGMKVLRVHDEKTKWCPYNTPFSVTTVQGGLHVHLWSLDRYLTITKGDGVTVTRLLLPRYLLGHNLE